MVGSTDFSAHAQSLPVDRTAEELFPPHPARADTPAYRATHVLLVDKQDSPCKICGVRKSTLGDTAQNLIGAKDLETHHYPIQREYYDGVDWRKVAVDFPQIKSQDDLKSFIDSPANMLVLCDYHHRNMLVGIHHALTNDWLIERYKLDGYVFIADAKDAMADIATDNAIVDKFIPKSERE